MREEILAALGLVTASNRQQSPPGALLQAQDVCVDRPNLIEPRPGYGWTAATVTLGSAALNLAGFAGHLLSFLSGVCVDETAGAAIAALAAEPRPTQRGYSIFQARASLYSTGASGMQKLESLSSTWVESGLQRALSGYGPAVPGAGSAWAYRFVLRRTDGNNYIRRSAPSGRMLCGGVGTNPITIDLQDDVLSGDVLEVYRSIASDVTVGTPADQLYLVQEINLTGAQISAKSVTFYDSITDAQVTGGTELYTNQSQLGILQSKDRPPWCTDATLFNRMAFYGDTRPPWRFTLKFWSTNEGVALAYIPNVFQIGNALVPAIIAGPYAVNTTSGAFTFVLAGDFRAAIGCIVADGAAPARPGTAGNLQAFTHITNVTFAAGNSTFTLDKSATATSATNVYMWPTMKVGGVYAYGTDRNHVSTQEFDITQLDTDAVLSLYTWAHIINAQQTQVSMWFDLANGGAVANAMRGENMMPVATFEWRDLSVSTAPVIAWNDLNGLVSAIAVSGTVSQPDFTSTVGSVITAITKPFTTDAFPGQMWVSAIDEPEAVPPVNFVQIGNVRSSIRRQIATRSALWVFKDDGLYRVAGYSPEALSVDLIDPTIRLLRSDAACASADVVFAWTTKGVLAISDGGITPLSEVIRDELIALEQQLASYPDTSAGVWMVYDQTERRVLLGVPSGLSQTASQRIFVWAERTGAWTIWVLTPNCAVWDPGTGVVTMSTIRHPSGVTTRYTDRQELRSALFPYGDDQQGVATVNTLTDLGGGVWDLVFNNDIVPALVAGDGIATSTTATCRVVSVLSAKHYHVDSGQVHVSDKPTILRACKSIVEWNLKPATTPFELKVYRDSRIVWNALDMMTSYTMTYGTGTQVSGGYTTAAQSVTVPLQYTAADYLRVVGVPMEAGLAGTFQASLTINQGGASWLCGGFAVSFEPGGEALGP